MAKGILQGRSVVGSLLLEKLHGDKVKIKKIRNQNTETRG